MFSLAVALVAGSAVCLFVSSFAHFRWIGGLKTRLSAIHTRELLDRQWPGALLFLAGALKTGLSLEQALDVLMMETPEPLKSQLKIQMSGEAGAVLPTHVKIEKLFQGSSLGLARAGLLFAHQSGGQSGHLLEMCATLLQQKLEMRDRVKALSAQSTASAWVVGLSPFGILALFAVFSPDYVAPLFSTRAGSLVLGLVLLLVSVGLYLTHKMARVEP